MKTFREIARILVGITFIFSGFVKGVDPLGTTYKFIDYFQVFGTDWANSLAFGLSILQSVAEYGIGIALLFNYRMKIFAWLSALFMLFFLPLTLWIAVANPVTDCGCFGDAFIITNWETFYKNVVLSILAFVILLGRDKFNNRLHIQIQNLNFTALIVIFIGIQFYSYNHLPIMDFRPYKIGVNINESMEIPDGAPMDEYKTEFIYKNKISGQEQEFDESNYPWSDTTNWEYVDSKSILIKEGYHPPIHDFTIENMYGEDIKDFFLFDTNYTFVLVSYNLEKYNSKQQEKINKFAQEAINNGANFICLTSSTEDLINPFIETHAPPYEFFNCDEITLKTIIRSNPGLVLMQEGTILNKWHWRDIPTFEEIKF